jgi:hypothetical protein
MEIGFYGKVEERCQKHEMRMEDYWLNLHAHPRGDTLSRQYGC